MSNDQQFLQMMYGLNEWLCKHELGNERVKLTLTFPTDYMRRCAEVALKHELQPDFVSGPHAEPPRLYGIEYAFEAAHTPMEEPWR